MSGEQAVSEEHRSREATVRSISLQGLSVPPGGGAVDHDSARSEAGPQPAPPSDDPPLKHVKEAPKKGELPQVGYRVRPEPNHPYQALLEAAESVCLLHLDTSHSTVPTAAQPTASAGTASAPASSAAERQAFEALANQMKREGYPERDVNLCVDMAELTALQRGRSKKVPGESTAPPQISEQAAEGRVKRLQALFLELVTIFSAEGVPRSQVCCPPLPTAGFFL